jgi:hypothetical protein
VWGEFGGKERKFCMELGGPAALEVRDRYGEPIVGRCSRVALASAIGGAAIARSEGQAIL